MTRPAGIRPPRLIAWETTRACNLACRHCRAEAVSLAPEGELDHGEARRMLKGIAAWPPFPMVILSGGEPLLRPDILELAAFGTSLGLRMLLSTNGLLLTAKLAAAIKTAGVARLSLSLDAPEAPQHDEFRGLPGAFEAVKRGAAYLREAGLPFQINSSLTAANLHQAEALAALAVELGAAAHHIFLLVPVGRAEDMESLTAEEYEKALRRLKEGEASLPIEFKATCAPQYQRLGRQNAAYTRSSVARRSEATSGYRQITSPSGKNDTFCPITGSKTERKNHTENRGCLAGQGFLFVGSRGEVQGCGYLPLAAGNAREKNLREIYETSPLFASLRDRSAYRGKCGQCEYWNICGGCRARAHALGDHLGPEPLCPHQPLKGGGPDEFQGAGPH